MDNLATSQQTVQVFAQIIGKELVLLDSSTPRTDGLTLHAPFDSPELYSIVEKLLAHIVFGSDALVLEEFVALYQDAVVAKVEGIDTRQFRQTVRSIALTLDEYRILSQWGQLYAGSELVMRERLRAETMTLRPADSVAALLRTLAAGYPAEGRYSDCAAVLNQALELVSDRSFDAVLLVTKWVVNQLVSTLLEVQFEEELPTELMRSPELRAEALHSVIEGNLPPLRQSQVEQPGHVSIRERRSAVTRANFALAEGILQPDAMAEKLKLYSSSRTVQTLQEAIGRVSSIKETSRKDVEAKVVFVEVSENEVPPPPLSSEDLSLIKRLRARSFRVLGRHTQTLESEGLEVDTVAAIQRRLSKSNDPIFRTERRGRGFRALTLVDRSSSMKGHKSSRAERASRILRRALDFPFSDCGVWGFQSTTPGSVTLTRYASEGFSSRKSPHGGMTPIHLAISVASKYLSQFRDVRQLYVVSDGAPIYADRTGQVVSPLVLMDEVREAVQGARKIGIAVTAVFVLTRLHEEVVSDVNEEDMAYMFGARRHWKIVADDRFDSELVGLVHASFQGYLRRC